MKNLKETNDDELTEDIKETTTVSKQDKLKVKVLEIIEERLDNRVDPAKILEYAKIFNNIK